MKLRLWAAALLSVAAGTIPAADFPGMRSYLQTVKLRYATEAEAEKSELRPMALPNWYRIAFSGRWDDNALNHYRTHAAMTDTRITGSSADLSTRAMIRKIAAMEMALTTWKS